MRDLDDLLHEARHGALTDIELQYVVNRIRDFDPDKENNDVLLKLLRIIEKSDVMSNPHQYPRPQAIKYRDLIANYLEYPRFDYVSAMALRVLCQSSWGFTEDYLDVIKKFIKGVEWDDGDCAICAMSFAGEYLNKKPDDKLEPKDIELAHLLKAVMDDQTRDDVDRGCAYEALARASGIPWNELLSFPDEEPDIHFDAYKEGK